jgi:hypothetical protein
VLNLPFQGGFLPPMQRVSERQAFLSPRDFLVALHKFVTRISPIPWLADRTMQQRSSARINHYAWSDLAVASIAMSLK